MSSDDGETKPAATGGGVSGDGAALQSVDDAVRTTPPGRALTPPTTIVVSDPFDDPPPRARVSAGQPMSELLHVYIVLQ